MTNTISENDKKIICETAEEVLQKSPSKIRFRDLMKQIKKERPEFTNSSPKEIRNIIFEWKDKHPTIVYETLKHAKGYSHWFSDSDDKSYPAPSSFVQKGDEAKFYTPFAAWLEKQKECTKAVSTGDKVRGKKWSNPDVVGVKKSPGLGGAVNYELISAEIKTSTSTGELITGLGQACAYKLFSHKSYLVVPSNSKEDDLQRIKELCEQYDIGLIVFDKRNPDNPAFEIRCSAKSRGKPNPSYVNNSIKELLKKDGYDIFD